LVFWFYGRYPYVPTTNSRCGGGGGQPPQYPERTTEVDIMNGKDSALFSKASDEWSTPQWLFDQINREFHIECDAAATGKNTKCKWYLGEDYTGQKEDSIIIDWIHTLYQDGLTQNYCKTFWLNPPYSRIAAFMKKAYEESLKGATVVCLIPARTDTKYWHDYCMKAAEIRFIKGRLKFGDQKGSAPFPSVVVIFKQVRRQDWENPVIGETILQPTGLCQGGALDQTI
jgi:site-specific DNA-methyltransferase (adenine-specific)